MSASTEVPHLANSLVIGVTGHRKLRGEDIPVLRARIRDLLLDLQARYPGLPLVMLSSLAEGSDQLAAQVALDLGLRVIAPLPLPLDLYRDDFDPPARQLLEQQLARAEVVYLPLVRDAILESVAADGRARDQQYAQAGIFVSSHCHVLLALWDGHESGRLGGTAQVVRFHLHGAMQGQVERRHAAATLLGPDQESVVCHLPTARLGDEGRVDPGLHWLTTAEEERTEEELPAVFARMFGRHAAFNADAGKYAAQIAAEPPGSAAAAQCPVWKTFLAADWLARTFQRRVAWVLRATYALVALMGFAFFTYTHVLTHDAVIYLFLALFLAGMGVMSLAGKREWQRKYLDYRTLAEGLRVQSYWRRAGIVVPGTPAFAHDNFMQKQDVELGWIRNVMRGASLDGMLVPAATDPGQVEAVIGEWIGTPGGGGQLAYYSRTGQRRAHLHHRAELLGKVCIGLGVALSVLLAVLAQQLGEHLKHALVSAMGVLSVAAAVHEAYMHKKADKELIRQYGFMRRIFGSAQRLLDSCFDVDEQRRVLRALGDAALSEHAEWSLMHRERPLPTSRI